LTTIFGDVPSEVKGAMIENHLQLIETDRPLIDIDHYVDYFTEGSEFLRHLCGFDLTISRPSANRSDAIFLMDHTQALDIIDYWNLRAIGWRVVPIASAVDGSDKAKELAEKFITQNEGRDEDFPNVEHRVTILKGRSITQDHHMAFVNSLHREPEQTRICQLWYPPMWDEFTYQRGFLRCSEVSAGEAETSIEDADTASPTWFKTVSPDFMEPYTVHGWRYANDVKISMSAGMNLGQRRFRRKGTPSPDYLASATHPIGASVPAA